MELLLTLIVLALCFAVMALSAAFFIYAYVVVIKVYVELLTEFYVWVRRKLQDINDERIIRSMERDVVSTCRRMTKVASR